MRGIQCIIVFCLIFLCYSCKDEDEDAFLNLSSESLVFSDDNSVKEVTVETNSNWAISSQLPDWLSVSSKNGEVGQSVIHINVSKNESEKVRLCNIIFSYRDEEKALSVQQRAAGILHFSLDGNLNIQERDTVATVDIEQNIGYKVKILQESKQKSWIELADYGNGSESLVADDLWEKQLKLHISENWQENKREAKVVIYNNLYNLSDTLCVVQDNGTKECHKDGEWLQLQAGRKGNVNLIFMGDGFVHKDLLIGGRYEAIMSQAMEYFFSIEPFASYRDYFNVYMVIAESEEEGVGEGKLKKVNNKFGTTFGSGTETNCNDDLVFEYARKIKELPQDKPLTIIMPLNSTKYAGTTYLYSNGNSIALCPMSAEAPPNDFEGLIHHEAGGHGFGFLCDEYVYHKAQMPESRKNNLREWQKLGFQCNLDFTDDLSSILWKDFIGIDKYSHVGAYEGGYEYQYGVWRSESNSCMNNNIPYYNVQSRWSIVSRIMKLAGIDFTVKDFIQADHVTSWTGTTTRNSASDKQLPPLGTPKLIKK